MLRTVREPLIATVEGAERQLIRRISPPSLTSMQPTEVRVGWIFATSKWDWQHREGREGRQGLALLGAGDRHDYRGPGEAPPGACRSIIRL
ncbi:hypothetical protein CHELA1G11_21380 [Hyphomicrobiales bacterium]|nr:hypothetical protein CHELA1G11_21380 [Hyphomicrobiales bacterium]CAH1694434.1 hypothetical protein CHELA1G2_21685 [Hyphomicrobiales bacterium]